MELSKSQAFFLDELKSGKNIYLTGKAGTGKSFIVKQAMEYLKENNKRYIALAPTGIAATNVNGQTLHSMFSINPFGINNFKSCNFLKGEKRRLLNLVSTIFIDEISMLRPDILDAINWTLIKNGCDDLTKKQIVFVGDLKQLPPPLKDNERSILFRDYDGEEFYHAKIYKELSVSEIELNEVQRQNDEQFIENLNIIREGGKSEYFRQFVTTEAKGIVLAPYNATVQKYNIEGLKALQEEEMKFTAKISGNVKAEDFNLETVVNVKNGAKIMYLANSQDAPLVNGTLGMFICVKDCFYIRVGEIDYPLKKVEFTKKEYVLNDKETDFELKEIGSIEQYPIRLAYALSIHKSQGLTFDEITIDLTRPCFQKGQLYVALSRVKSPSGLNIIT